MEDEIEFPTFNNEDDDVNHPTIASVVDMDVKSNHDQISAASFNSDEEIVSDDEVQHYKGVYASTGSSKLYAARDSWFRANEEVATLVQLNRNSRAKLKPKFSFPFQPQKECFPSVVSSKNDTEILQIDLKPSEELEGGSNGDFKKSMAEALEVLNGRKVEQPHKKKASLESPTYGISISGSVASFLDKLQENGDYVKESGRQHTTLRGRQQFCLSSNVFPSSSESTDDESLLDGRSSADNEPVNKPKTMVDLFHEALGAVSPDELPEVEKHSLSDGLFDKLQQVTLNDKGKYVGFLDGSTSDDCSNDKKHCLDVRILSRSLEAKHNVCCCAIIPCEMIIDLVNGLDVRRHAGEQTITVVFNSRICGDVDLDVGSVIRIHPPWKEVRVQGQDDVILLSTCFSEIV